MTRAIFEVWFLLLVWALAGLVSAQPNRPVHLCGLDGDTVQCSTITVGGVDLIVMGEVSLCSEPIAVTLVVKPANGTWQWEYTFVNVDETQVIAEANEYTTLHVQVVIVPSAIHITASFVSDNEQAQYFLDETLQGSQESHCGGTHSEVLVPLALLSTLCGVLILSALLIMVWWCRWRHQRQNRSELLTDTDPPSLKPNGHPASGNPPRPTKSSSSEVKNACYRAWSSSTDQDEVPLPTIPEEDIGDTTCFVSLEKDARSCECPHGTVNKGYYKYKDSAVSGGKASKNRRKKRCKKQSHESPTYHRAPSDSAGDSHSAVTTFKPPNGEIKMLASSSTNGGCSSREVVEA